MRVVAVHIAFTDDGTELVGRVNRTFVHIYPDAAPVAFMDQLRQINLTHHGWHHVAVLQMEIIVRSI